MMRTTTTVTALLLALLLGGCESVGTSGDRDRARAERIYKTLTGMGLVRGESVRRVRNFRINGWQDIDERTLILTAGVHDHYLVELITPCYGLDFAFGIGLSTNVGALTAADSVLVRGMHGEVERCPIRAIWALEDLPGFVEGEAAINPQP